MEVKKKTGFKMERMASAAMKTAACCLCFTMIFSFLTGELLSRRILPQEHSGYAVMLILLTVSAIAAKVFGKEYVCNAIVSGTVSGLEYFLLLLLITWIFYGGKFEAIFETALMIAAGSFAGAVWGKLNRKGRHKRRK